jgi:hypothetical protein
MKKITSLVLTTLSIVFISTMAFAASNFGSITPEANKTFSVGTEYFRYSQEWSPEGDNESFKSIQNQFSANFMYNINDKIELKLGLGMADFNGEDIFEATSPFTGETVTEDFEGDYKPFGTIGVKGVAYQEGIFSVGPFAQFSMYSNYEKDKSWSDSYSDSYVDCQASLKETIKIKDQYDLTLGLTGQADVLKSDNMSASIYAGPYYRLARAKGEVTDAYSADLDSYFGSLSESYSESISVDLENKDEFGFFIGTSVNVGYGVSINGEGQFSSEPSYGVSLTKSF